MVEFATGCETNFRTRAREELFAMETPSPESEPLNVVSLLGGAAGDLLSSRFGFWCF